MEDHRASTFLQGLRGAQGMVVLAYFLVLRAMSVEELMEKTGLSDNAIYRAVKGLAAKQELFKQVGRHGRITWVPAADTLFGKLFNDLQNVTALQNPQSVDSGEEFNTLC